MPMIEPAPILPLKGFSLIWCRGNNLKDFAVYANGFATAAEAGKARRMSGDLIVDNFGNLVPGEEWLFEWEKTDPQCYVRQMQAQWCRSFFDARTDAEYLRRARDGGVLGG